MRLHHIVLAGLLGIAACRDALSPFEHQLRWNRLRPASYSFEYQQSCFCIAGSVWWKLQVRDGSVVSFALVNPDDASRIAGFEFTTASFPTIDGVFDRLQTLSDRRPAHMNVDYDRTWHFPATISVDESFNMADDELVLRVRAFSAGP